MFQAGTRVYVCGSATVGKKLGPKRHSLGYVSSSNMAYVIKPVKGFPIEKQRFVLFPLKVVFTRYGKEKRERCEYRDFLNVVPIFFDPPHKVNAGQVQEAIRVLKSGELSKNTMWYDIGCNYSNDPSNIGTLIPVYSHSVSELQGNEAMAWVSAVLRNDIFRHLMIKNKYLPTLQAISDVELMNWISNAMKGNNPRRDLMRWASDSADNMRRLVTTVRVLTTTFFKRIQEGQKDMGSVSLETNSFITWLMNDMFSDIAGYDSKMAIAKGMIGNSNVLSNLSKSTKLVRDIYLTLKPKYI